MPGSASFYWSQAESLANQKWNERQNYNYNLSFQHPGLVRKSLGTKLTITSIYIWVPMPSCTSQLKTRLVDAHSSKPWPYTWNWARSEEYFLRAGALSWDYDITNLLPISGHMTWFKIMWLDYTDIYCLLGLECSRGQLTLIWGSWLVEGHTIKTQYNYPGSWVLEVHNTGANLHPYSCIRGCVVCEGSGIWFTGRAEKEVGPYKVGQLNKDHVRECSTLSLEVSEAILRHICSCVFTGVHNGWSWGEWEWGVCGVRVGSV